MKAVICRQYGPPEVLQLSEVKKPVPKGNEILVRIRAATVTAADFRVRSFTVPLSFWLPGRLILGIRRPRKPILGLELAGEVEAVGQKVRRFKQGDAILASTHHQFGAYAEYACLPENGNIAIKPDACTYEEAAALPVGAQTALHYLKQGNIQQGHKILIYGASGSVGTYAVQLAKCFGAEVTGVCSKSNLDLVRSLGADKVVDYTQGDFTHQLDKYDAILVTIDKWPFSICNRFLKEKGTYLNVTAPIRNLPMLWTSLTSHKKFYVGGSPPSSPENLTYLAGLVETGVLKPVIDRNYTLDQIVEAHRYVDLGHKKGNVVITVR